MEIPNIELIMQRSSERYPDEIGFKQNGYHYCQDNEIAASCSHTNIMSFTINTQIFLSELHL